MKIIILSFKPAKEEFAPEEFRLKEEAENLGHSARILRTCECRIVFDGKNATVLHQETGFPDFDILIPRPRVLFDTEVRISILKQFELMGKCVLNSSLSISWAKNKIRTQQILNAHGIPTPKTFVIESLENFPNIPFPVILKDPYGTYGMWVMLIESFASLRSVLDGIWATSEQKTMIVQEFVRESAGEDIRVFVLGEKVVAAMKRKAQKGEFRSNMELGATGEAVQISKEYADLAINAVKALGLDCGGVDIIESRNGPLVLEVNANSGFKALEKVSGVNVAKEIIKYAISFQQSCQQGRKF